MAVQTLASRRVWRAAALILVCTSCAHHGSGGAVSMPGGAPSIPSLFDTAWRIQEVGGTGVADSSGAELRIGPDGQVSGSTGCNRFTGSASLEGTRLSFSPLESTRRACEPGLMDQEERIIEGLGAVASYAIADDGKLNFLSAQGEMLMKLTRAEP